MKYLLSPLLLLVCYVSIQSQTIDTLTRPRANQYVIDLTRSFSNELFGANGAPWAKPLVEATNASVNSRFFSNAYIPRKVDKPYFKIGLHMSTGLIPDSRKWMKPNFAVEEFRTDSLLNYIDYNILNSEVTRVDTAGLGLYLLKTLVYDGINSNEDGKQIIFPERSPTMLGPRVPEELNRIIIQEGALAALLEDRLNSLPEFLRNALPEDLTNQLEENVNQVPSFFTLPNGSGMTSMTFAVPQIEIGSLWGTEFLIRYIPQLDYGENIGEFGFWGLGISHSLSQYFFEADSLRTFDLAIQAAYQSSELDQVFGETGGTFNAMADIFNINIHGSMPVKDWFDVYAGYQFEIFDINSKIEYFIGVEQQRELGMLPYYEITYPDGRVEYKYDPEPENGFPGDTEPQYTDIGFTDQNHKLVLGVYKQIGPVALVMDYSISQFNLFSFGVKYIID